MWLHRPDVVVDIFSFFLPFLPDNLDGRVRPWLPVAMCYTIITIRAISYRDDDRPTDCIRSPAKSTIRPDLPQGPQAIQEGRREGGGGLYETGKTTTTTMASKWSSWTRTDGQPVFRESDYNSFTVWPQSAISQHWYRRALINLLSDFLPSAWGFSFSLALSSSLAVVCASYQRKRLTMVETAPEAAGFPPGSNNGELLQLCGTAKTVVRSIEWYWSRDK